MTLFDEPPADRTAADAPGDGGSPLPFLGRERELAELHAALETALTRPARRSSAMTLVTGRAGIGKTRLVEEFCREAEPGIRIEWTRVYDVIGGPSYGPWTRVARSLLDRDDARSLAELVLDDGHGGRDRRDLFDEVGVQLRQAIAETPTLIVIDDLHDADVPTLLLTRHLARQLTAAPALIIATARHAGGDGIGDSDDSGSPLGAIAREVAALPLSGLSVQSVSTLLADARIARRMHAATEGNPLFLEQLLHPDLPPSASAAITPARGTAPSRSEALREVIRARLDRLEPVTRSALGALTVVGGTASPRQLAVLLDTTAGEAATALAAASRSGILRPSGRSGDTVEFRHALFAELCAELSSPGELELWHRRAAEPLAGGGAGAAEQAHHLLQAGAALRPDAVGASLAAGDAAVEALAFEDAARHYSSALDALAHLPTASAEQRADARLRLGRALARCLDPQGARDAYDEAWREAQAAGSPALLAQAALGPEYRFGFVGGAYTERARRCETALLDAEALPEALQARLHAAIAGSTLGDSEPRRARAAAQRAAELAESSGDPVALGCALIALFVTDLDPASLEARIDMARRVAALADETGEIDLARNAHFLLMGSLLEKGDVRAVDAELASRHRESSALAVLENGRHAEWFRCMRALLEGRIEHGEQFSLSGLQAAQREGDPDALSVHVGQLGIVRWLQGREHEVEPHYLQARQAQPAEAVWTSVLARLWALDGRTQAARAAVEELREVEAIPRDRNWLITLVTLAEAAALVGDTEVMTAARDQLLPFSHRLVPIGLGIACWGTVARPLALVARGLGRHEEADAHLRTAMEVASAANAQPWLAEAQLDLARALATGASAIDDPDGELARRLLAEARATVAGLGIEPLRAQVDELAALFGDEQLHAPSPAASPRPGPSITVLGTFEVVGASGRTASWTSRKARELLKLLITRRGTPLTREAAIEALWPGESGAAASNRLSVALSTIRRALDPERSLAADALVESDQRIIALRRDRVAIDVEEFLASARQLDQQPSVELDGLRRLVDSYRGDALADEPYADWATPLRDETRAVFFRLCRRLGDEAVRAGDLLVAADAFRRILADDPYDEPAYAQLIEALTALGAHGQARAARAERARRMAELGIEVADATA